MVQFLLEVIPYLKLFGLRPNAYVFQKTLTGSTNRPLPNFYNVKSEEKKLRVIITQLPSDNKEKCYFCVVEIETFTNETAIQFYIRATKPFHLSATRSLTNNIINVKLTSKRCSPSSLLFDVLGILLYYYVYCVKLWITLVENTVRPRK